MSILLQQVVFSMTDNKDSNKDFSKILETDKSADKEFKKSYIKKISDLSEVESEEKDKILLVVPISLVNEFDHVIPPWHTRTSAIIELIRQHVEYIKWQQTKEAK